MRIVSCSLFHPSQSTCQSSAAPPCVEQSRIYKRLRSPRIDSNESIHPAYAACEPVRQPYSYPRFLAHIDCSKIPEQVTNFGEPNFLKSIISDLTKLMYELRKKLHPLRADWSIVPVPLYTAHIYPKITFNLIEKKVAPSNGTAVPQNRKRSGE
jgi:hypothetical protein